MSVCVCVCVCELPMVNIMFDQAAIDGRYFIRMGRKNSRNPTARQPVTQTGIQQHHISTAVQLKGEQESVSVCVRVFALHSLHHSHKPPIN